MFTFWFGLARARYSLHLMTLNIVVGVYLCNSTNIVCWQKKIVILFGFFNVLLLLVFLCVPVSFLFKPCHSVCVCQRNQKRTGHESIDYKNGEKCGIVWSSNTLWCLCPFCLPNTITSFHNPRPPMVSFHIFHISPLFLLFVCSCLCTLFHAYFCLNLIASSRLFFSFSLSLFFLSSP